MKIQLLPTTINANGCATQRQHMCCLVIDDRVTIDAGSLATAITDEQREGIRDVILTHAHLDHIAGLPLFIDDLFATLKEPIKIHATKEVIEALDAHIFNWVIYPRFHELSNKTGQVMRYEVLEKNTEVKIAHLNVQAIEVNHKVPSIGMILSDEQTKIAFSGDTAEMDEFWQVINKEENLDALFVECAFPNELDDIAHSSHHLTPKTLGKELLKFHHENCPIYVINLKPMYREKIVSQLTELAVNNLHVFKVGEVYNL